MKIQYRIAAFTIMEMTVAMLLAALTVGITYTAYRMISRSYQSYDEKNQRLSVFIRVDQLLKKEVERADRMERTIDGIALDDIGGRITYHFTPGYILREQYSLERDTFYVTGQDLHTFFEGKEITQEGQLLDQVSWTASIESGHFPLIYTKKYSAAVLFDLPESTSNP